MMDEDRFRHEVRSECNQKKIFLKIIYITLPIIKNFWLKTGFQLK